MASLEAPDIAAMLARLGVTPHRITADSRVVRPGDAFAAFPGARSDGRAFIPDAIGRGASVVFWEAARFAWNHGWTVANHAVDDLQHQLGQLADFIYGSPSSALWTVGVTGTNGKTTCASALAQCFERCGRRAALMGTVGNGMVGAIEPAAYTTPDAAALHEALAAYRGQGARAVAMEVSSHGLDQGRVNGVAFDVALFTNLSRDHLDYHGTMAAYGAAKARLFAWPGLHACVINRDDAFGQSLADAVKARGAKMLTYGFSGADIAGSKLRATPEGSAFTVSTPWGRAEVDIRLVGAFNAWNALGVLGVLLASDVPLPAAVAALAKVEAPRGRMERQGGEQKPLAIVDYAHSPDALEKALTALRPVVAKGGELVCVFGCGGNRDPGKRPEMGRVAGELADRVFVTSDNPRDEEPGAIAEAVVRGVRETTNRRWALELDRATGHPHGGPQGAARRRGARRRQGTRGLPGDEGCAGAILRRRGGGGGPGDVERRMMDTVTAATVLAGRLVGPNVTFTRVATDTRTLEPGDLFVALEGERFDGHAFVDDAFARGAAAALVTRDRVARAAGSLVRVADSLAALGQLAEHWRRQFAIPVIVVVGSNGKTTVKEMTASILRARFGDDVLATRGNLNNAIGLPLTLLGLRSRHRVAVVELGMNHPGETAELGAIAQPTVALVNNAQREHQEFMKSVGDVAAEHAALIRMLPAGGVAVTNADDAYASVWRSAVPAGARVLDFGFASGAAVRGEQRASAAGLALHLHTPWGEADVTMQVAGRHNARNALAAAAAALAAGADLDAVVRGLAAFRPVAGRLVALHAPGGAVVIDDSYNANPDSVQAAIAVLASAPAPRWLVLGDMGEVGNQGPAFHREAGASARAGGIERLLCVGMLAAEAAAAFGAGAEHFASVEALAEHLAQAAGAGVTVLVKGSRFMRMERVVERLCGGGTEAHP